MYQYKFRLLSSFSNSHFFFSIPKFISNHQSPSPNLELWCEMEDVVERVRSLVGSQVPEAVIIRALSESGFDSDAAFKFLIDNPAFLAQPLTVVRTTTSTGGARVLAPVKQEVIDDLPIHENNPKHEVFEKQDSLREITESNGSQLFANNCKLSFDDFLIATNTKVMSQDECMKSMSELEASTQAEVAKLESEKLVQKVSVKEEPEDSDCIMIDMPSQSQVNTENRIVIYNEVENGDFLEDPEWLFVGGSVVMALSTTKGRKLVENEIVHFNFPSQCSRPKSNSQWIVRISTKRFGEVDY